MDAFEALFSLEYFDVFSPLAFEGLIFGFLLAFVPWFAGAFFRMVRKFFE